MANGKEHIIYNIAKKLNISPATVSRGLQDRPAISKQTKKKIADTFCKMDYRSNHFARNLRQKETKTISLMVHEPNSGFITSALLGNEKVTAEAGYELIIAHSSESSKKEAANTDNLFQKRVDGLIASLFFGTKKLEHFESFKAKGVSVVFFDRVEPDGSNTAMIIDNQKCGYEATSHLLFQGCKRIAHITSKLQRNVHSQRFRGYKEAFADHGIALDKKLLIVADSSEAAAVASANKVLAISPRPDGLFITNDFVAAVVMRTLKEAGSRIPEDVAVVGFNNDIIGNLIEPQLTTVNCPGKDNGTIGARHLINHLKALNTLQQTNTVIVRSD